MTRCPPLAFRGETMCNSTWKSLLTLCVSWSCVKSLPNYSTLYADWTCNVHLYTVFRNILQPPVNSSYVISGTFVTEIVLGNVVKLHGYPGLHRSRENGLNVVKCGILSSLSGYNLMIEWDVANDVISGSATEVVGLNLWQCLWSVGMTLNCIHWVTYLPHPGVNYLSFWSAAKQQLSLTHRTTFGCSRSSKYLRSTQAKMERHQ